MVGKLRVAALMLLLAMGRGPAAMAEGEATAQELESLKTEISHLFTAGDGYGAVAAAEDALETSRAKFAPFQVEIAKWLAEMAAQHLRRSELKQAEPYVKGGIA